MSSIRLELIETHEAITWSILEKVPCAPDKNVELTGVEDNVQSCLKRDTFIDISQAWCHIPWCHRVLRRSEGCHMSPEARDSSG